MAQSEIGELQVLITAQADKFNEEIAKVQNQIKNMSAATGKLSAKTIALGSILGNIATKAFGSLVGVVRSSRQEYENTSASLTKLATVMQQRGATQAQYNEVVRLTEAEEKLGVVSASAMQNGLQELATYVGKAESLKKLTNTMNNLIVQQHGYNANEDQALQTATMMGKVLQGQTGGMERIGYHLDEADKKLFNYGTEEERVALLTSIVNDNLGDMNRRLGETNAGKQIQLANTWSQLRAQIGELATAVGNILIPVFSAIANVVGRAIAYIKAFLKLFGVETGNAAASTASSVSDASEAVSDYGDAAEGAAKKAKKALAAFDEMNVLTEETSSGSGGGGGGVDILGDLEASANAIDWGSLIPDIELPDWLKSLSNIFSDIDLETTRAAFSRLWQDIQEGAQPVMQVVGDLWENYLKPLVTWAGNELLPAFLNALGGTIQFVGQAISSVWEVALKPFIDAFLVPIAQWTGGVIVKVLNAIGDGLRDIAKNKKLMDTIAKGLAAVGSALAVAKVVKFFNAFSDGIKIFKTVKTATGSIVEALSGVASNTTGLTQILSNFGGNIAQTVSNGLNLLKTGFSSLWDIIKSHPIAAIVTALAGLLLMNEDFRASLGNLLNAVIAPLMNVIGTIGGVIGEIMSILGSLLSSIIEPIAAAINVVAEVLAVVVNAVAGFIGLGLEMALQPILVVLELIKPVLEFICGVVEAILSPLQGLFGWLGKLLGITNDNTEATKNNRSELSKLEKQYDKNGDGALSLSERLEYLEQCMNNENKAEKDLIMAQKTLAERMVKLDEYVQRYNKTADELIQMHHEGKLSELAQGEALNDLTLAVIDLESANYNVKAATEKYNQEQGETQSQANQLKEQYDVLGETLIKVAENGERGSLIWNDLIKKMDSLAKKIQSTGKNVGEMRDWYNEAIQAGKNVSQGAADGVDQNAWKYTNSMIRMGQNGLNAFKQFNVIRSPSRLMRKMGGFIGKGAALGVMDTYEDYRESLEGLAEIGEDAFNTDLSTGNIDKAAVASVSAVLELDSLGKTIAENISVNNTVNIGSETFYKDIVDNINEQSHLTNRCVLNI